MSKIICVGFHKTGTTSLGRALEILGYSVAGPRTLLGGPCARGELDQVLPIMDSFDACQDNPWPLLFRELDQRYPGSRFILTVRPPQMWVQSARRHFRGRKTAMRKWIYGHASIEGKEEIFIERMERHNQAVRAWFADRPDDLLELHLTRGEGWETLCPFLDQSLPDQPFPHLNKRQSGEPG